MNNKIKFAFIDCEHIGKCHAEMIVRNVETELVAFQVLLKEINL